MIIFFLLCFAPFFWSSFEHRHHSSTHKHIMSAKTLNFIKNITLQFDHIITVFYLRGVQTHLYVIL